MKVRPSLPSWRIALLYGLLILVNLSIWSLPIHRPLDLPSWHEFDDASMARNFIREPSGILYPRIDWRKDGPGFVESELPLLPWLMSQAYRLFGMNIVYGRILNLAAMLAALLCFTLLARSLLPESGALIAVLIFGLNRVVNFVATALQPEAFMFLFYIVAVYSFLQWRAQRRWPAFACTIVALSLAILEKSPAAHLGLFFLFVLIAEEKWNFMKLPANWALAVLSLLAPAIWYAHAHKLWITYGNSLGLSNEHHWIDWDILRHAGRPVGLLMTEVLSVFAVGALLLTALALFEWRSRAVRLAALWYCSILIYYVVTIRTTGGAWAWYYHIVSVAPAALLAGSGFTAILRRRPLFRHIIAGAAASILSIWLLVSLAVHVRPPTDAGLLSAWLSALSFAKYPSGKTLALVLSSAIVTLAIFWLSRSRNPESARAPGPAAFFCAAGIAAYLFLSGDLIAGDILTYSTPTDALSSAESFRGFIPQNVLIVSSGGICFDDFGHRVAFDNPYMFYWLDRKGFALCAGEQSVEKVRSFAARGAQFFVAEKSMVGKMPGFETELKKTFPLVAEGQAAWLFDLRRASQTQPSPP